MNLLTNWGELSLPFTSNFIESISLELKLDLSDKTLSKLFAFFNDWPVNHEKAWNKLQESILDDRSSLLDIIEQIYEIDALADLYFIPQLRKFINGVVLSEKFYNCINEETLKELEQYIPSSINKENIIVDIQAYRIAWLALVNYHWNKNNFAQIDFLSTNMLENTEIKDIQRWMKETLPAKYAVLYLKAILCSENQDNENSKVNFNARFEHALSILKEYFPNYFHYTNSSDGQSFFTYMFMTIADNVQTAEQAEKLFSCISELSPLEGQNHLKITENEQKIFVHLGFYEANCFQTASSILLTRAFRQIFHNFINKNCNEVKQLIKLWHNNIKLFEQDSSSFITDLILDFFYSFSDNSDPNNSFKNFADRINVTYSYLETIDFLQETFHIYKEEITKKETVFNTKTIFEIEMTENDVQPLLDLLEDLTKNEYFSFIFSLLFAIQHCHASDELKNKVLNVYPDFLCMLQDSIESSVSMEDSSSDEYQIPIEEPCPAKYASIFDLWEKNKCIESSNNLRKYLMEFDDLNHLVNNFCIKFGYSDALRYSLVLIGSEKKVWLHQVCQYVFENDSEHYTDFLKDLKRFDNNLYIKKINKLCLQSDDKKYIEILKSIIEYTKTELTKKLTLKKYGKLLFDKLMIRVFKRDNIEFLEHIAELCKVLLPKTSYELKNIISLFISTIDVILGNEIDPYSESQFKNDKISQIINIIDISRYLSFKNYKNTLKFATNYLTRYQKDHEIIPYRIETISNKLIEKCLEFFNDSSFLLEPEFLKEQLELLENCPLGDKFKTLLSSMLCFLNNNASKVAMAEGSLSPLGKILGEQNNIGLLREIKECRPDERLLWGNLTLIDSYLISQRETKEDNLYALNCFSNFNFNFVENMILSFSHPLPSLKIEQEQNDEREKEREMSDQANVYGKRRSLQAPFTQQKRMKIEESSPKGKEKLKKSELN